MSDRSRFRRGRAIQYNPTPTEVTSLGSGPWPGIITQVHADGSCDIAVDPPSPSAGSAVTDPLITSANPTAITAADPGSALASPYITNADATDAPTAVTLANEIKTKINATGAPLINANRALVVDLKARAAEIRTELVELKTDVNLVATLSNTLQANASRKASVKEGSAVGQFSFSVSGALV